MRRSAALLIVLSACSSTSSESTPTSSAATAPDGSPTTAPSASSAPALPKREPLGACAIPAPAPQSLADTGCYEDLATQRPARGLIPYDVNAPLWSDGTWKRRFFGLPGATTIGFSETGAWTFPEGSILVKEFYLERLRGTPDSRRILETRFLIKRATGWQGVTYKWNDSSDEATLFPSGGDVEYAYFEADGSSATYVHFFPPAGRCDDCHSPTSGGALGPRTAQVNRAFDYAGVFENQLTVLDQMGVFGAPLPSPPSSLPAMADPLDSSRPLDARARAYLEANCAHCHHQGAPTNVVLDLHHDTPLSKTGTCGVPAQNGDFGIAGIKLIEPGDRSHSMLYLRMHSRDALGMPPLGSHLVDEQGAEVVGSWIDSMIGCPEN